MIWHFIKRDLLDSIIGWTVLVFVTAVSLVFTSPRLQSFLSDAHTAPDMPIYVMGYMYLMFAIVSAAQVWGEHSLGGQSIARAYLLSLPVSRRRMFWLCMLRSSVGAIPLGIFSLIAVHRVFEPLLTYGLKHQPELFWWYYPWTIIKVIFVLFFLQITAGTHTATMNERIRRTAGRWPRILAAVRFYLLTLLLDFVAFAAWMSPSFSVHRGPRYTALSIVAATGALGYFLFRLRRNYRNWIWE